MFGNLKILFVWMAPLILQKTEPPQFYQYWFLNWCHVSQGPFDGILAFSQGATMVSLICGLKEQEPGKLGWKSGLSQLNWM